MLAAPLPSHSVRSNKGISLSLPRVKTNTGARAFHSCGLLFETTSVCPLSHFSCFPQEISEDTSPCLGLSPIGHQHTKRPVDVTELLHRFCYWTPIQLSNGWAWPHQGYWRYKTLIERLIDVFFTIVDICKQSCHHLDLNSAKPPAQALVFHYFDYCNSVCLEFQTLTSQELLQRVQNRLSHIGKKSSPFIRSAPLLCSLHWLIVNIRIDFPKLLTYL